MIDPRVLELSRRVWRRDPTRLNFETSLGMLAWVNEPGDVFERDGEVVGWARMDPAYPRIRSDDVWDMAPPMLTWLTDDVSVLEEILDSYDGDFVTKHAAGDADAAAALAHRGFRPRPDEPFGIYLERRILDYEPAVSLDGYQFLPAADVWWKNTLELRAAAHRAGWPDSTRTADDWAEIMDRPTYNPDFDVVALFDDEPVGAALLWVDELYCEFEPVGVSPEHRGRGLAAALLRYAMLLASNDCFTHVIVGARGDDDYPGPRALYESVGFTPVAREVIVSRRSR